jgi:hypothetical protein
MRNIGICWVEVTNTAYCLSKYCMNNANGNMGSLAQATAMYGYYADSYFNS